MYKDNPIADAYYKMRMEATKVDAESEPETDVDTTDERENSKKKGAKSDKDPAAIKPMDDKEAPKKKKAEVPNKAKEDVKEAKAKVTDKEDDGEGMDPVGKGDSDIDNDGDSDESDEYLKNRRKKISKSVKEATSFDAATIKVKGEFFHDAIGNPKTKDKTTFNVEPITTKAGKLKGLKVYPADSAYFNWKRLGSGMVVELKKSQIPGFLRSGRIYVTMFPNNDHNMEKKIAGAVYFIIDKSELSKLSSLNEAVNESVDEDELESISLKLGVSITDLQKFLDVHKQHNEEVDVKEEVVTESVDLYSRVASAIKGKELKGFINKMKGK